MSESIKFSGGGLIVTLSPYSHTDGAVAGSSHISIEAKAQFRIQALGILRAEDLRQLAINLNLAADECDAQAAMQAMEKQQ